MSAAREAIVRTAREWLGTPFHHAAAVKGVGCDCIGLVGGVAAECGIDDAWVSESSAPFKGYGRQPDPVRLLRACDELLERIDRDLVLEGDVLVLRFEREPQHFAIVTQTDPPYMIHAYAQARRVVENRIDELWSSRVVRAYRFRGLD